MNKKTTLNENDLISYYSPKTCVTSQKNRLLAVVLMMTGCSQASLIDDEGRGIFVDVLNRALNSDDMEVCCTEY